MAKNQKKMVSNLAALIGSYFPKSFRAGMLQNFVYADIKANLDFLLLGVTVSTIVFLFVSYIGAFLIWPNNIVYVALATVVGGALPFMLLNGVTYFLVDARTKEIEKLLPDALNMIASNIEGGMTPYNAILVSARPEFGPLSKELKRASNRTMAGAPFYEALTDMSYRINSSTFSRTVRLLVTGMRSGGDTVHLLRDLSLDIREFQKIKRAVITAVMSNTMFIGMATTFGAPMMFAVSMILLGVLSQMGSQFSGEDMASLPIPMVSVSPEVLGMMETFAFFMIFMACMSSGAMIGLIKSGKVTHGVKYAIPMLVIALILFSVVKGVAGSMFSL